jgi:hypothetical protein
MRDPKSRALPLGHAPSLVHARAHTTSVAREAQASWPAVLPGEAGDRVHDTTGSALNLLRENRCPKVWPDNRGANS